jgi:CheY-like chemotaxis protein
MEENVVLVVEDSAKDLALVLAAFEEWGVKNPLQIVSDGQQATDYLAGNGIYADRRTYPLPSLVLLDLLLPKISGLSLLAWIRARPDTASLPVVVLTGSRNHEDFDKAHRLGATACAAKSHDLAELREVIQHLNYFSVASSYNNSTVDFFPEA